ncbi:MAG: LPS export ABC transporter ATP-binding protein [Armatimonadetes bacterium]|nr:LPS export ABC transporter ATP-binding protein [Candidatus Hippobium faecium]
MKIRTSNLVKIYKGRRVVNNVSFEAQTGEIVGLLGANGAGKTTSFYMMTGLIRPDGGNVYLDDLEITNLPMYKRARLGVGYLPQEASVFRKLTVEENIKLVLQMTDMSKDKQKQVCDNLIREFSLEKVRDRIGQVLSGGERRRVEIARALATDPKFILLDEPFTGVDPISINDIQNLIRSLRDRGIGIIITDHNVRETLVICDRAYIMGDGEIKTSGKSSDLPNDPIARKFYLGENFEM